jgi:SAM-dependent methyltransferase
MDLQQFRAAQRQIWAEGDYPPVGRLLEPGARILVEAVGITEGQRVLDVATGSGTVAALAAQAGAQVVGVDITDAWFDEARRRADAAGVAVDLRVGDAEDLPVEDDAFDVVLSSFGAIFAPQHDIVASELVRVCRPGGTIALTAWTPGGSNDEVFSALFERLPSPPEFVTPFIRWGDPAHVRELFASRGATLSFERRAFEVAFPSAEAFEDFVFETSGGFRRARQILEQLDVWEDARAEFRSAIRATNEADDGRYRATWDFLLVQATKASRSPATGSRRPARRG